MQPCTARVARSLAMLSIALIMVSCSVPTPAPALTPTTPLQASPVLADKPTVESATATTAPHATLLSVASPTAVPTKVLTATPVPTSTPTAVPAPTKIPTAEPTEAPTAEPTPTARAFERPPSGPIPQGSAQQGGPEYTSVHVENGTDDDALVVFVNEKAQKKQALYVRASDNYTVELGKCDGQYEIFFSTGQDFDDAAGKFTRSASYEKFEEQLDCGNDEGGWTYEITLHAVVDGNARTDEVDPNDFPGVN